MKLLHNLDWGNWTYGLIAALIGGGSAAAVGGIAILATDTAPIDSTRLFKAMAVMFAFNGCKDALLYLKQNPLPKVITVTTTETKIRQVDPPAVVTTTVEETKVTQEP